MLKYLHLIVKNLGRNKLRTALTAIAVMVLVAIYSMVTIVTDTINKVVSSHSSQTRLIVRERWVAPSRFPMRYVPKIAAADGVVDWTVWHYYAGDLDDAGNRMAGMATRMDNLAQMHPDLEALDPAAIDAVAQQRTGALVGSHLMNKYGWKVGQKFTLTGVSHLGKNLTFTIVGVLPSELWANTFFFREDYYQQAAGDEEHVNVMWLRVRDVATGRAVAASVEQMFANSQAEMRVETESAGVGRISESLTAIVNIITFVATVLLIDMVVILANSISMTVRERRTEMAILKVLGFQPGFVAGMVIGEAVLVGIVAGTLGAAGAYGFCQANAAGLLPTKILFLVQFAITPPYIVYGAIVGALVGFFGSVIPAWNTRKVQVATVFSTGG